MLVFNNVSITTFVFLFYIDMRMWVHFLKAPSIRSSDKSVSLAHFVTKLCQNMALHTRYHLYRHTIVAPNNVIIITNLVVKANPVIYMYSPLFCKGCNWIWNYKTLICCCHDLHLLFDITNMSLLLRKLWRFIVN